MWIVLGRNSLSLLSSVSAQGAQSLSAESCLLLKRLVVDARLMHDISLRLGLSYDIMPGLQGWLSQRRKAKKKLYHLFWPNLGRHSASLLSHSICHKPTRAQEMEKQTPTLDGKWQCSRRVYRTRLSSGLIHFPITCRILNLPSRLSKVVSHFSIIFRFQVQDPITRVRSRVEKAHRVCSSRTVSWIEFFSTWRPGN